MSGSYTTKESNSHTSRETESSHQARPQRNSSSTKSRRVAAPKKSLSMARTPVTSAAGAERTNVTASKRPKVGGLGNYDPNALNAKMAKLKEEQAAAAAKAAQDAAEKKQKEEEERAKRAEERKSRIEFPRNRGKNTSFDTTWVIKKDSESDGAAIEPQRNSAAKKGTANDKEPKKANGKKRSKKPKASSTSPPVSTSPNEVKPTTTEQMEQPNAESDSTSTETASDSHDATSSPVPPSALGDTHDRLITLRTSIRDSFLKLNFSQFETFIELLNEYCGWDLSPDDEFDLNDIPDGRLQIFATWIRGRLSINEAEGDNAGDLEHPQDEATQSEDEQTEQSEPQLDKSQPSALADGVKKRDKRSLDDEGDDQFTSEDSHVHRSKRARSLEPCISPSEKRARFASRRGSLDLSAMPSSTQHSVTVYSAAVNSGFVPTVTDGMIPFGAVGHAAQKHHDLQEQRFNEQNAPFMKQEPEKQIRKRSASAAQLLEPIAKKMKQSDEEMALENETEQATEESMAEAKSFKQEEIVEKPEVASSDDIDYATPVQHTNETATGEDTGATEIEPTTKEEAGTNNDEENQSPSSSADSGSNNEKQVTEETSKTGSASTNTSSATNEHQDATQGDNENSQASDEESAESHINETAATTTKQEDASHNGEAESTPETKDGQQGAEAKATDAPTSTMTSGSATQTDAQQETAPESNENHIQDRVTKASKTSANDSDSSDTDDESDSDIEIPVNRKVASISEPKPQRTARVNNDQHSTTNKQGAARRKRTSVNTAPSAQDKKKSTSKAPAASKPSAVTQQPPRPRATGPEPNRFELGLNKFTRNDPPQASNQGRQAADEQPLGDKTNTVRQPTKPGPKKTTATSTNKQPEVAKEQPASAKAAASKKRSRDDGDAIESTKKPAEKKQRKEASKKRSRDGSEDEDETENDDTGRTKKRTKKQGTNQSSTTTSRQPDPDASNATRPTRESRSRAAANQRATDAACPQVPRQVNEALWVNFDEVPPKSQSQAQTQAPGPVEEDEHTEKNEQKDEQTNGDAEDAPASNDAESEPQKKKSVARPTRGEQKKKEKKKPAAQRPMSAAAQRRKVGRTLFHER